MEARSAWSRRVPAGCAWLAVAAGAVAFALHLGEGAGPARAGAGAPEAVTAVAAADAPARLRLTGLYLADGSVDPRNRPFAPQYPLWTDGAEKSRWIRLPEGAVIEIADLDAWRFPVGTTVWKEFAWNGRKVETRMIRRERSGEWTFASYVWNEEQTDAILAPAEGIPAVVEVAPGRRHSIPGREDCLACHGHAPSTLLGFSALQLSDDRDPHAPHAEPLPEGAITLATLVREGRVWPPRQDLVTRPPRIRERTPEGRAALGYLSGNCGSCHNPRGPLARLGFSLLHDAAADPRTPEPARATAVGRHGRFVPSGALADSSFVIAPGAPERSTLLHRMSSRRASSQMPPLGSVVADTAAASLVRRWILSLSTPS